MPTKKKWDPSTYKQVTPTLTPIIKETPREKIIFPTKYKIIPESITQQNSSSNVYVNKKEFLDSPVFKPYMDRLYEINSRPNSRRDINPQALYKDIQSYIHKDLESKEYSEDRIKSYYKKYGKNVDISGISMGIGKLKLNSFTPQEKTMLGLTPESIQEKETAIKAATYLYLKNRKQFEEYAEKNPQLNITEDDIRYMTILSYNQGTKKLLNLGYNNIYKSPQEEVETLRELATPKKIKDVTSTKFQYLPGVLKDWAYSMKYPEGHIPYINRVLNHGNKVDLALIAGNF